MEAIRQLVDGKTVALVGNAMSLLSQGKAAEIDAHDVVVRINAGVPPRINPKLIGRKFTIWATARHFINEVPVIPDVAAVLWMKLTRLGAIEFPMLLKKRRNLPATVVRWPRVLEDECAAYCRCDPGVGLRLLWWLKTKAKPASVSVYGMDSWATPTTWSLQRQPTSNHNPAQEAKMVKLLCEL